MGPDTEIYVDATSEDGQEFCFQYAKKIDPVYALGLGLTKKWPEGSRLSGATWVHTKDRLDFPICPALGKPYALMDSGASHMLLPLSMLKGKDLEDASRIQVNHMWDIVKFLCLVMKFMPKAKFTNLSLWGESLSRLARLCCGRSTEENSVVQMARIRIC
eukprot:3806344-Amphidinium_carterae.2